MQALKSFSTQLMMLLIVFFSISLFGCGDFTAGGPGTGGSGPIIIRPAITSSSIDLIAMDNSYNPESNSVATPPTDSNKSDGFITPKPTDNMGSTDTPTNNETETKKNLVVNLLDKSANHQLCGNFSRSINLMSKDDKGSDIQVNKIILDKTSPVISVQTLVQNTSNKEDTETRFNCSSYQITDNAGNVIAAEGNECPKTSEATTSTDKLLFLAKQTHFYNLNLKSLSARGKYRITYMNQADSDTSSIEDNTDDLAVCQTYLDIEITEEEVK